MSTNKEFQICIEHVLASKEAVDCCRDVFYSFPHFTMNVVGEDNVRDVINAFLSEYDPIKNPYNGGIRFDINMGVVFEFRTSITRVVQATAWSKISSPTNGFDIILKECVLAHVNLQAERGREEAMCKIYDERIRYIERFANMCNITTYNKETVNK